MESAIHRGLRLATRLRLVGLACLSVGLSCVPVRDSPFSSRLERDERSLNAQSLERLSQAGQFDEDGVLRIAVLADSHQYYRELDTVIEAINSYPGVDLVIHLGDFTDFAYNVEYDRFLRSITRLGQPSFVLLGNHDALGAGPALYRQAFGPANVYFEHFGLRFIAWNSADIENPDEFDSDWLIRAVAESSLPVIILTHVPLDDRDRFHHGVRERLAALAASTKVIAVLSGHVHKWGFSIKDGTVFVTCPYVVKNDWLVVEITSGEIRVTRMDTGETVWAALKSSF